MHGGSSLVVGLCGGLFISLTRVGRFDGVTDESGRL